MSLSPPPRLAPTPGPTDGLPVVGISQRRYLGSKARLAQPFRALVEARIGRLGSFADVFAGTGVVADTFNQPDVAVVANDLLRCNHLALQCFLGTRGHDPAGLQERLRHLDALPPRPGYVAQAFGGTYFSPETAGHLDAARETIADWAQAGEIDAEEEAVLVTALLYAADRAANTCGHYDAFRRVAPPEGPLRLRLPWFDPAVNQPNRIFNEDANTLTARIQVEALYLDPPYNSRQYSDTYHLLENLARWEKPPVAGVAAKMDRRALKSRYCSRRQAARALDELVQAADCRWILLSYNNMGDRGDDRSNARISDADLQAILGRRGKVEIHAWSFRAFNAGLSEPSPVHEERLFLCDVATAPRAGEPTRVRFP